MDPGNLFRLFTGLIDFPLRPVHLFHHFHPFHPFHLFYSFHPVYPVHSPICPVSPHICILLAEPNNYFLLFFLPSKNHQPFMQVKQLFLIDISSFKVINYFNEIQQGVAVLFGKKVLAVEYVIDK